jgi:uncharacterized protein (TIGR02266 family)
MSSPPTPSSPRDPGPQRQQRIRLERKVSLKFKNLMGFVTELSENISMGGMFLRIADPPPPGTLFDFELTLEDEGPLIQGIAEVVWVRELSEGPRQPAGMGVRFLELAPGSRALIYQMVDEHIVAGGEPFELEGAGPTGLPETEPAPTAPTDPGARPVRAGSYAVLASPQRRRADEDPRGRRPGGRRRQPARRSGGIALWATGVLAVGLGVATVVWLLPPREPETASPTVPESAPPKAQETEDAPQTTPETTPATEIAPEIEPKTEPEIEPETGSPMASAPATPPSPAAAPTDAEEPRSAPELEPTPVSVAATALEDVTWRRRDGALVVTLTADAPLLEERWDRFRMDEGTPREVVRIRGIREGFRPVVPVGEPELVRIRTGHHRTARGDELHVVLDLGSPNVRLTEAVTEGRRLHLTLTAGE